MSDYRDFERQPVEPCMVRDEDINRCGGCGIQDRRVECGGIYHCPNPLCRASGAFAAREAFKFHAQTEPKIYPTDDHVALRGWALRMVASALEMAKEKKSR